MGKNEQIKRKSSDNDRQKKRETIREKAAWWNVVAGMNKLRDREKRTFCKFHLIYASSFFIIGPKSSTVSHGIVYVYKLLLWDQQNL